MKMTIIEFVQRLELNEVPVLSRTDNTWQKLRSGGVFTLFIVYIPFKNKLVMQNRTIWTKLFFYHREMSRRSAFSNFCPFLSEASEHVQQLVFLSTEHGVQVEILNFLVFFYGIIKVCLLLFDFLPGSQFSQIKYIFLKLVFKFKNRNQWIQRYFSLGLQILHQIGHCLDTLNNK